MMDWKRTVNAADWPRTDPLPVRLVRTVKPRSAQGTRFQPGPEVDTIADPREHLVWRRCPEGMSRYLQRSPARVETAATARQST